MEWWALSERKVKSTSTVVNANLMEEMIRWSREVSMDTRQLDDSHREGISRFRKP